MCRVEHFKLFSMGGVDVVGCSSRLIGIGVSVRTSLLDKIFPGWVQEVQMANLLTKTMWAMWVIGCYLLSRCKVSTI